MTCTVAVPPGNSRTDGHRLVVIVGIRSQYVKLASFQRAIERANTSTHFTPTYVDSGQHFDEQLSTQFREEFDLKFDFDLRAGAHSRNPSETTARMIIELQDLLAGMKNEAPIVVVFGDANTTLAASIAARKAGLKLVHVEAGVRTYDDRSSEEINRVVADALAHLHLASSHMDMETLKNEGYGATTVFSGDLVRDLVKELEPSLPDHFRTFEAAQFSVLTLHRAENTENSSTLLNALQALHDTGWPVVFVAHPRSRALLDDIPSKLKPALVLDGLSYYETLAALKAARLILTDSGALQRESFYLKRQCVVRQDRAFWQSLIAAGVHREVSSQSSDIAAGLEWLEAQRELPYPDFEDFGDGEAADKILEAITQLLV